MHLQKAFHDNIHISDSNIHKVKYILEISLKMNLPLKYYGNEFIFLIVTDIYI